MKHVFAYTPTTPTAGLVGYINLSEPDGGGALKVTVRRAGDGQHAEIELPDDEVDALTMALMRRLMRRRAVAGASDAEPRGVVGEFGLELASGGVIPAGYYVVGGYGDFWGGLR